MEARYLASTSMRVLCARTGQSRVFAYDERTEPVRPVSALHVARADFDLVLARRAREHGAAVWTATRVGDPELRDDHYAVATRGADGKTHEIKTRFVIDASGEARWMSARASTPSEREGLDGTVMETHVAYAQPSAGGAPAGAADLVSFAHGALWMLPMRGGVHAIGAAVSAPWAAQRKAAEGPEEFFDRTVRDATILRGALSRSQRLHGVDTRVPVATKVERRAGPRWIAVGAAGGTVDPVLGMDSALAMLSVREGLAVVRAVLDSDDRGDSVELSARARFEEAMDEAEAHCERVARAVYRGALADACPRTSRATIALRFARCCAASSKGTPPRSRARLSSSASDQPFVEGTNAALSSLCSTTFSSVARSRYIWSEPSPCPTNPAPHTSAAASAASGAIISAAGECRASFAQTPHGREDRDHQSRVREHVQRPDVRIRPESRVERGGPVFVLGHLRQHLRGPEVMLVSVDRQLDELLERGPADLGRGLEKRAHALP